MRYLVPMFVLLAACGNPDQDKLPDDLTSAEGVARSEPEFEVEPEPEPAPANNIVDVAPGPEDIIVPEAEPETPPPMAEMPKPSFSCSGRLNRVEAMICTDPQLANIDRRFGREYVKAMDEATPEQRARLERIDRQFLTDRNRCPTTDCVLQSYRWVLRDVETLMGWQIQ